MKISPYVMFSFCLTFSLFVYSLAFSAFAFSPTSFLPSLALDVGAFERLLGPCKEIMQRNFEHYEEQLMQLFGTTLDISDAR